MPRIDKRPEHAITFQVSEWKHKRQRAEETSQSESVHDPSVLTVGLLGNSQSTFTAPAPQQEPELQSDKAELLARYGEADESDDTCNVESTTHHSGPYKICCFDNGKLLGFCTDGKESLCLYGTRLASSRECTRDEDCEIYKLELRSSDKHQATMVARKSGGDAMVLQAPMELHGQEADDYASLAEQCPAGWSFTFECDMIRDGDKSFEALLDLVHWSRRGDKVILWNDGVATWKVPEVSRETEAS